MKPILAVDYEESKLKFPIIAQPKIDGLRAIYLDDFTGRSLKRIPNKFTYNKFSNPIYKGLDGELVTGWATHPDVCRRSTSAFSTIEGEPDSLWLVFDYITEETLGLSYSIRYNMLLSHIKYLRRIGLAESIVTVPRVTLIQTLEELLEYEKEVLEAGYEGVILRDPYGLYKSGRTTVNEGNFLRIKRSIDEEAIVIDIIEGATNNNPKTTNELGKSTRSSHKENKVPNGQVGSFLCIDLKTDKEIIVSAGKLNHNERKNIFENREQFIGAILKYRKFKHGEKDKPRFPRFISWRPDFDR